MLDDLIQRFNNFNKRTPSHVNELLDYIQQCYIREELTLSEYKAFFSELDKKNAEKPDAYVIRLNPFDDHLNIPS